ncbi:hypothetical protein LSH36_32g02025 [Paralvinella palmiformis]|uniref:Tetratricopeptide repeat protein n=1 Tax=Paralvinella palmiformis TaxID=53620 RepID=A0AAD9K9K1_9ANNE|nr:hypothetical protein LSH36_32g02025 [Paralvinella palmiformis]
MQQIKLIFKEAETCYQTGNFEHSLRKYYIVIDECEKYLETEKDQNSANKDYTDIRSFLGECYNKRGLVRYKLVEFAEAVQDFTKALKLKPNMAVAFYNRGLIHYRLGNYEGAIIDMKAALNWDAGFTSAKQCLEECFIQSIKHQTQK